MDTPGSVKPGSRARINLPPDLSLCRNGFGLGLFLVAWAACCLSVVEVVCSTALDVEDVVGFGCSVCASVVSQLADPFVSLEDFFAPFAVLCVACVRLPCPPVHGVFCAVSGVGDAVLASGPGAFAWCSWHGLTPIGNCAVHGEEFGHQPSVSRLFLEHGLGFGFKVGRGHLGVDVDGSTSPLGWQCVCDGFKLLAVELRALFGLDECFSFHNYPHLSLRRHPVSGLTAAFPYPPCAGQSGTCFPRQGASLRGSRESYSRAVMVATVDALSHVGLRDSNPYLRSHERCSGAGMLAVRGVSRIRPFALLRPHR